MTRLSSRLKIDTPNVQFLTGKTKFLRKKLSFLKNCYYLCTAKCVLMEKITERIEAQGGTISTSELNGKAEYERLRRAVQRGEVVKLRHGVYAEPTAMLGTMIDVERIVPGGVVCLYNAWMYYQLCTTVPPTFCIAIDAKRKVRMPEALPITLYYWKAENLTFGIVQQEISGFTVRITDLERSVCDAVKYRNKIGLDICAEIIRCYVRREDRNLSRLMDYAKKLRLEKVLNNYLEIAIE